MTAPQPDQQPQGLTPAEDAVVLALAVFFASTAAVAAVLLPAVLAARLVSLGLSPTAVRAAGRLALAPPLTGRGRYGSPVKAAVGAVTSTVRDVKADEPLMRARYVIAAARRLTDGLMNGTFPQSLRVETAYLQQHRGAARNRVRAAINLDRVAAEPGAAWLRWRTTGPNPCPVCSALNGWVFTVGNLPAIPGAVHPGCSCVAEPAATGGALPTIT